MVFGLNCYGASLSDVWLALGAVVVNGTPGVNWLPEPSLSTFLRNWLGGKRYSAAVQRSNRRAPAAGRDAPGDRTPAKRNTPKSRPAARSSTVSEISTFTHSRT